MRVRAMAPGHAAPDEDSFRSVTRATPGCGPAIRSRPLQQLAAQGLRALDHCDLHHCGTLRFFAGKTRQVQQPTAKVGRVPDVANHVDRCHFLGPGPRALGCNDLDLGATILLNLFAKRTTVMRRGRSMSGRWISPTTVRLFWSICTSLPCGRTVQCSNGLVMTVSFECWA